MKSTSTDPRPPSTLASKAEKVLKDATQSSSSQRFLIVGEKVLYRGRAQSTLSAYTVRPITFDLAMSACVLAYLLALLVILQGWAQAQTTLLDIFRGKKVPRKRA